MTKQEGDNDNDNDKINSTSPLKPKEQRQIVLNLYNSGIEPDVIAYQLDISQEEANRIIREEDEEKRKELEMKQKILDDSPSMGNSFYLDAVVNIDLAIKSAQTRMWKALRSGPEFNISTGGTNKVLNRFSKSKITFVILHIDLVGSTQLSMTLPLERLTTIIQTFSQEMSIIVELYGGHVLKYIGDAVLAFFVTKLANEDYSNNNYNYDEDSNNDEGFQNQQDNERSEYYYLPCINAINCARSMIKVVKEGINPILNQFDYSDISVRIGIDIGEVAIIQYGWDIHTMEEDGKGKQIIFKEPHYDILGHTINVAAKMTSLAKPNGFTIGQSAYNILDEKQKSTFERLDVSPNIWSYLNEKTGKMYQVYSSTA
jgi:class 3 adenylate cyclase